MVLEIIFWKLSECSIYDLIYTTSGPGPEICIIGLEGGKLNYLKFYQVF